MPIRSYVKGIVRKTREKFYSKAFSSIKSIGAKTEAIFTAIGIRRITPEATRKLGLSPDRAPDTLIIKSSISPFSSQVAYDPRFRRYVDQSTKKIISRTDMRDRLNVHRTNVLLVSAKQRKPNLSDSDLRAIVDNLEDNRRLLNDAISAGQSDDIIDDLLDSIEGDLGDLGVDSP